MAQRPSTEPPPPARDADWPRLDGLLDRLLDLSDEEARAVLDRLPPEEAPLRPRLEAALAAARTDSGALSRPAAESWAPLLAAEATEEPPSALAPGTRLGAWRIEGELGRGGMGTVYAVARADGAFEQRAALKLLKASADEPAARARFQRERQILARLEHPAIARLLDGGVAPDGRPWLVIERVDGAPINAFSDARRLTVEARLRLFAEVLAAVDFAHRNLIVHRDLKPSNILVSESGAVKLLDFGIAKLLDEEGEAERTSSGAPLTPQYAAPEQVTGAPVTTATDVYALGMVLYELLSGARPYRVASGSALELERAIVDTVPPPPSTSARRAADAATARGSTAERLERRLAGDLDAIVLKAIAKDPTRRYPSAAALGEDLARHLAGRPVLARPDALGYRVRSFVRRHRLGVAATLLVILAVAGGAGATLWQTRARLREARKASQVGEFLVSLFREADPDESRGRTVTAQEILDRGARRIEVELKGQPEVQAELLTVVGRIYIDLGLYESAAAVLQPAIELRRRAPGSRRSAGLAASLWALGQAQMGHGDLDAAEASLREALREAVTANERDSPEVARIQMSIAAVLRDRGRYEEAEKLLREALPLLRRRLGEDHPDVAAGLAKLADLRDSRGDYKGAESLLRDALALMRKSSRAESWETAAMLNRLGAVLREADSLDASAAAHIEALETLRRVLGETHPEVATTLHDLAAVRLLQGDLSAAASLHEQVVGIYRQRLAPDHHWLGTSLYDLARVKIAQGDLTRAEQLMREALAIYKKALGPDHQFTAMALAGLGEARIKAQDPAGAEAFLKEALTIYRRAFPRGNPVTGHVLVRLGEALIAGGRPREAEPLLREALEICLAAFGAGDRRVVISKIQLGACLTALARYPEAEALLLAAHEASRRPGAAAGLGGEVTARLVALYERWGRKAEAARYRALLAAAEPARGAQAGRRP